MSLTQRFAPALASVIAASLMALSATAAHAASQDQTQDLTLTGSAATGYTAATSNTHLEAGSFEDTFRFKATSPSLFEFSLVTMGANQDQLVSFSSVWLNGTQLTLTPVPGSAGLTYGNLSTPVYGDLVLTVKGYVGGTLIAGSPTAASYSSTFNLVPASAVPEPQSYALFLGGLGLMVVMLNKRRKQRA
jgi:hypothetical protein